MSLSAITKTIGTGARVGGKLFVKYLPTILTAFGTAGVIYGTIRAVKKAPEAHDEFQKVKNEWDSQPDKEKRDKVEYAWRLVKVGARYYGVVALIIGGSIVCFWVANHMNLKRLTAALAAAKVSSDYAKDLEDQIKKNGGDKALNEIKDNISADKIQTHPCDIHSSSLNTIIGETPIYDPISERWYPDTVERVKRAELMVKTELSDRLLNGEPYAFVSFNEFREWAGLRTDNVMTTETAYGDNFGFGVAITDKTRPKDIPALVDSAIAIDFTPGTIGNTVGGLILRYDVQPSYRYDYG